MLGELNRIFGKLYASEGRPSIPPEQLLSALLLQVFYGIRSERQLMGAVGLQLRYRWFVGLSPDDPVWDPTTFTKNRERLQTGEVIMKFMTQLLTHPQVKPLLSDEHFSVDGTLIEAWASQKSFRPKDGSGDSDDGANFHGQKRKNDTHASTSDPYPRLYRKAAGREAKLSYPGHAVMENRHGLAVAGMVTHANGTAERRAAEIMLKAKSKAAGRRITAGEDKAYDTADHVAHLRARNVTPHVTQNNGPTKTGKSRRSAIHSRSMRTCCAMPPAISSQVMVTIRDQSKTTLGTRISSTPCATPSCRRRGSRISGATILRASKRKVVLANITFAANRRHPHLVFLGDIGFNGRRH